MKRVKSFAHLFPPSSFSSIMGIEMLSLTFYHLKLSSISFILLWLGIILYIIFLFGFALRAIETRFKLNSFRSKQILLLFTFTAGTDVLGTRLYLSSLSFLSPLLLIGGAISFLILLLAIYRYDHFGRQITVNDRPLYFVPLIGALSLSILTETIYGSFSSILLYTVPISAILIIVGEVGMWIVVLDGFRHMKAIFMQTDLLNSFTFIYFGIFSLTSVAIIEFAIHAVPHSTLLFHILLNIAYVQFIIIFAITAFIFYHYFLKIKRGHFKLKYSASMWASVFSMGISALGYWLFFHLTKSMVTYYASMFYALAGTVFLMGICSLILSSVI